MTRIPFILLSTTDGSPVTGATPTVTISKDGGTFASATNTPAEIGNGYYYVDLTTEETTVNNNAIVRATATGAQPTAVVWEPEPTIPTAADNATAVWGAQTKEVTIATAQAETFATTSALTTVGNNVLAVKAKTDNLPANPAAVGSEMALTEATVTAVKSGLATSQDITNSQAVIIGAMPTTAGLATSADVTTAQAAIIAAMPDISNLATATDLSNAEDTIIGNIVSAMPDISGLSTFNAATDTVTIDATQAAGMATADVSGLATATAQAAQTAAISKLDSSVLHWAATVNTLTLYDSNNATIAEYTLTRDGGGNITAIAPKE